MVQLAKSSNRPAMEPSGLPAAFPAEWLGEVVQPTPVEPADDAQAQIAWALDHPLGSLPFGQLVHPGQPVTILIDDYSRPTPTHLLLKPVLKRLEAAGIPREDIRLVTAPGSHRRMTNEELLAKTGGRSSPRKSRPISRMKWFT
jgi:nickel-dependent lactate racemase